MTYLQEAIKFVKYPSILELVTTTCPDCYFQMEITREDCLKNPSCHRCWKQEYKGEVRK